LSSGFNYFILYYSVSYTIYFRLYQCDFHTYVCRIISERLHNRTITSRLPENQYSCITFSRQLTIPQIQITFRCCWIDPSPLHYSWDRMEVTRRVYVLSRIYSSRQIFWKEVPVLRMKLLYRRLRDFVNGVLKQQHRNFCITN